MSGMISLVLHNIIKSIFFTLLKKILNNYFNVLLSGFLHQIHFSKLLNRVYDDALQNLSSLHSHNILRYHLIACFSLSSFPRNVKIDRYWCVDPLSLICKVLVLID